MSNSSANPSVGHSANFKRITDVIEAGNYLVAASQLRSTSNDLSVDEQLTLAEAIQNLCLQNADYTTAVEVGLYGTRVARTHAMNESLAELLIRLGAAQSMIDLHAQSLVSFEEACSISPNDAINNEAYYRAGAEAYLLKRYELAAQYFSHKLPKHLDIHEWIRSNTLRGDTYARIRQIDKAGEIYTKTLERAMDLPVETRNKIAEDLKERVIWLMKQQDEKE